MALKICSAHNAYGAHAGWEGTENAVTEDYIRVLVKAGAKEPWAEKYLDRARLMRALHYGTLRAWHTDGGQVLVEDTMAQEMEPTWLCAAEYGEEIHAFPLYGPVILCGWHVVDGAGTLWHLPREESEKEEKTWQS